MLETWVRGPLGARTSRGSEDPGERGYIGAVTRMGVRFRGVSVTEASE